MPLPDLEAPADLLVETAYAKVNLALHVRARRDDGYHALESLFVFAEHGDRLEGQADADGAIDLVIDGPFAAGLDTGSGNLVMRAAKALQDYLGTERGARLRLTKRLPVASGIGGGSADAAATLRLLARLWDARIDADELAGLALVLGSDVPACVASVTQMVSGRGEHLARHGVAGLEGLPMLLVNPGVAVSTTAVFSGWDGQDRGPLFADRLDQLIGAGRNDLERPAMALAPAVADILGALKGRAGLKVARMSGSGATCFALFDDDAAMGRAADAIRAERPDWWTMETRIRSA